MNAASIIIAGLVAGLLLGQTPRVIWDTKEPYADRIVYNGQRYKTIQVTDKLNVWASMNHTDRLTVAVVVIMNTGTARFDVDPDTFTCTCTAPKTKSLKQHWPFAIDKSANTQVLRANTVLPGSDIRGLVGFERVRKCREMKLVIPIQNVSFEFPFTHEGGGASGNMN